MNRLNGAKCLVYSKDGIYKGMYICVIQIEENQEIGVLMNNSLGNMKKVTILVKDIKESLFDCKLTIVNGICGKFYALKNYEVTLEGINGEDAYFCDEETNITSRIKEISEEEYKQLTTNGISDILWNKIRTSINGENMTKDKAFEYLCEDLINRIKLAKEGNFHPRGGNDGGRDYTWKWSAIDNPNIDYLDLPEDMWIMQCKYSEEPKKKLRQTEVWDEIIKVIQYNPNHYILFTNRDITTAFKNWWDGISKLDGRNSKFIPFSLHIVYREDIERLLNLWHDIKNKYFD